MVAYCLLLLCIAFFCFMYTRTAPTFSSNYGRCNPAHSPINRNRQCNSFLRANSPNNPGLYAPPEPPEYSFFLITWFLPLHLLLLLQDRRCFDLPTRQEFEILAALYL